MTIRPRVCKSCHKQYQHYVGAAMPDQALCSVCLGNTIVITSAANDDEEEEFA
ncbi:MAG: hypothetical protein DDT20_00484 [Firmicutes bacterium]|nr:hypothetical protein [Bacillota bacterium]